MEQIDVIINEDGKMTIKTTGFSGETCIKEIDKVLEELRKAGIDVKTLKIEKTAEYNLKVKTGANYVRNY